MTRRFSIFIRVVYFAVIMPPSALEQLTRLNIVYPMLFKLTNKKTNRITHCGVLEFVADEGKVYLPYWVCNRDISKILCFKPILPNRIIWVLFTSESKDYDYKLKNEPNSSFVHVLDYLDITEMKFMSY